ncbi:MAG: deoxyribodipyrimidine photo-lyase [Deltaproteobacteria bacterium]|nr:deoxyribodipyrimidine photo-lyase [Deltaproteobacteria bacterium]
MESYRDIEPQRIELLSRHDRPCEGTYVLYWMQAAQREHFNPALELAIRRANELDQPLLVGFGLMDDFPEANLRHYRFMLQGLADARRALARREIKLVVLHSPPDEAALQLGRDASLIVTDRGHTRVQRQWRNRVAEEAGRPVIQVETNLIVPVDTASDKREYAARTLRSKVHKHLPRFLHPLERTEPRKPSLPLQVPGMDVDDPDGACARLNLDRSVDPVDRFTGGQREARRVFQAFLDERLKHYAAHRNQPQTDDVSYMSMYLHFGQVSPVWLALELEKGRGLRESRDVFIEELLVRRELAHNYTLFEPDYDRYDALPDWAKKTLGEHRNDAREHLYTPEQLEEAATHDPYWNAAMREMRHTGYMHNHMRMYWGKKILEWTDTPENAFSVALALNNRYLIDGRDPNSYAGVAWVFGLHDRPWPERPIFGKVRYMAASGLERKCDPEAYVRKVDRLVQGGR